MIAKTQCPAIVAVVLTACSAGETTGSASEPTMVQRTYSLVQVVDGDTIKVKDATTLTVRLIGIVH